MSISHRESSRDTPDRSSRLPSLGDFCERPCPMPPVLTAAVSVLFCGTVLGRDTPQAPCPLDGCPPLWKSDPRPNGRSRR
jgi:hypothetical protein